jgi:hypothetical protein
LLRAIDEILDHGIPTGARSSTYELLHEGERFPPKLVVSIANRFANGEDLDRQTFRGGLNREAFQLLERAGFVIEPKRDQFESGYENLKKRFLAALPNFSGFRDEKYLDLERQYKDELVKAFDEDIRPYADNRDWVGFGAGSGGFRGSKSRTGAIL